MKQRIKIGISILALMVIFQLFFRYNIKYTEPRVYCTIIDRLSSQSYFFPAGDFSLFPYPHRYKETPNEQLSENIELLDDGPQTALRFIANFKKEKSEDQAKCDIDLISSLYPDIDPEAFSKRFNLPLKAVKPRDEKHFDSRKKVLALLRWINRNPNLKNWIDWRQVSIDEPDWNFKRFQTDLDMNVHKSSGSQDSMK